jgi:hypothetical protein
MEGPVGNHLHSLPHRDCQHHEVKVEYYENGGDAVAKVTIAP